MKRSVSDVAGGVPDAWSQASVLSRVSMAHAVHAHELNHPMDDTTAVDRAGALATDPQVRVQLRAWLLGESLGMARAWGRFTRLGLWLWLGMVVVIVLLAWGMGAAVMGDGARIHLLGAVVSLLGANALMLLLWVLSLFSGGPSSQGNSLALGGWLPRLWQWAARRGGKGLQRLLPGALAVLRQVRGMPWLAGLISHSAWALGFALILLVMGWGFAFRAYQPVLETTILSPEAVNGLLDALGWLPQWLGVPRPGLTSEAANGQWAWWLMACVLVYGLLPRVLLTALSAWVLRRRLRGLRLPEDDAGYQWALARFQRLDASRVLDPDRSVAPQPVRTTATASGDWALLVHELPALPVDSLTLELQQAAGWTGPPAWAGACDGSASALRDSVAAVAALSGSTGALPHLLVCVAGAASPDRSVARLLRGLLVHVSGLRLVLWWDGARSETERAAGRARWQRWLQAEQLPVTLLDKDLT